MMDPEEIHKILVEKMAGAEVTVQDTTGTRDHFQVHVVWSGFKGKSLIEQHQAVNRSLADFLEDGRIHALAIKTYALQ
ncbi:MAG: BolA/IbaG family iron-sulfur metabolism protein [Candidatus Omnitrophica bacterium]|nr:BolA/IbaG family iron-sulfur metabolism protein [Candidatus Omnitrophota bacterium]